MSEVCAPHPAPPLKRSVESISARMQVAARRLGELNTTEVASIILPTPLTFTAECPGLALSAAEGSPIFEDLDTANATQHPCSYTPSLARRVDPAQGAACQRLRSAPSTRRKGNAGARPRSDSR